MRRSFPETLLSLTNPVCTNVMRERAGTSATRLLSALTHQLKLMFGDRCDACPTIKCVSDDTNTKFSSLLVINGVFGRCGALYPRWFARWDGKVFPVPGNRFY
jgi:hypothetical protein